MSLCCLLSVPSCVKLVGSRCVCMVGRLFVSSGLLMLGRFPMVPGGPEGFFDPNLGGARRGFRSLPIVSSTTKKGARPKPTPLRTVQSNG
jgi:hypothetical protein